MGNFARLTSGGKVEDPSGSFDPEGRVAPASMMIWIKKWELLPV
jgi:hypothetical protein